MEIKTTGFMSGVYYKIKLEYKELDIARELTYELRKLSKLERPLLKNEVYLTI